MPQDKEFEVKLQFLEEAQEYLDTIESVMLGLATHSSGHEMDAALRAAHSIKGGAAMMGFQTLSQLAHRLEDSFKVLKGQGAVDRDTQLEGLLLTGVDCLRQVSLLARQGTAVDDQWLATQVNPIFEQLHQRLGDPQDEVALLSQDEGQDMVVLLFETEVEGCLHRLEAVLSDPQQPCLKEELAVLAEELGSLGEILQLDSFISLCASVAQQLEANPDKVDDIARSALQAWRRSQALVMVGQRETLPCQLELAVSPELLIPVMEPAAAQVEDLLTAEVDLADLEAFDLSDLEVAALPLTTAELTPAVDLTALDIANLDADFNLAEHSAEPAVS
ncbi:MAG TPA: Hpt domain-containing protein, partial [Candidatus Caenarcaniphilales bacterium]